MPDRPYTITIETGDPPETVTFSAPRHAIARHLAPERAIQALQRLLPEGDVREYEYMLRSGNGALIGTGDVVVIGIGDGLSNPKPHDGEDPPAEQPKADPDPPKAKTPKKPRKGWRGA